MEFGFLVFLCGFVVCALLVFLVSFFGVQGQTFEEALEAQRNKLKEKEKKKEKKKESPVEKKKKPKKGKEVKDAKLDASDEEETVIVEPPEEKVEQVVVPSIQPAKEEAPKKEKKKEKKREEKRKEVVVVDEPIVEQLVEAKAAAPVTEEPAAAPVPSPAPAPAPVDNKPSVKVAEKAKEKKAEEVKRVEVLKEEPAAVVAEPVAVAAATAVAAPAVPAPVAAPSEPVKKNKMEIHEITGTAAVEVEKKKAVAAAKEPKAKAPKGAKNDILSAVRQATLSDPEVQALIDVLLLKQSGKDEAAEDWIEPGGKESEAKKAARQLAELTEHLAEEQNKATNLEKKLISLRRELNEEKAARSAHKRELEELGQKKLHEVAALNANLQQVMGQLSSAVAQSQQLESNQAHYQATIAGLQAQVKAGPTDPALLQELDKLRNLSADQAQEVANLQQKVAAQSEELERLTGTRAQLEQLAATKAEAADKAAAHVKQLEEQLAGSRAEAADKAAGLVKELEEQLAAKGKEVEQLTAGKLEVDQQLAAKAQQLEKLAVGHKEMEQQLATKMSEVEQLAAAKLSAEQQLAAAGKTTESESSQQAAAAATKSNLESQLSAVTAAKQQLQLELSVLKEKLVGKEGENTRLMEEIERLSEQFASSVERPAAEGEEASSKMNGHSSPVEERAPAAAAPAAAAADQQLWEEKIQALTKQQDKMATQQKELESELMASKEEIVRLKSKNDEQLKELGEQKAARLALLGRLFPALPGGDGSQSLDQLEQAAANHIKGLEGAEEHKEEMKRLEAQIATYKTVLAQTENMLNSLQASVETAESSWEKKFQEAISSGSATKSELEALRAKNTDLHTELAALKLIEKEVGELKKQLAEEMSSKQEVAVRCTELQQLLTLAQQDRAANKTAVAAEAPPPLANGSGDQE